MKLKSDLAHGVMSEVVCLSGPQTATAIGVEPWLRTYSCLMHNARHLGNSRLDGQNMNWKKGGHWAEERLCRGGIR